jgi:hypothetical protein
VWKNQSRASTKPLSLIALFAAQSAGADAGPTLTGLFGAGGKTARAVTPAART